MLRRHTGSVARLGRAGPTGPGHGTVAGVSTDGCCWAKAAIESCLTAVQSGAAIVVSRTSLPFTVCVGARTNVPALPLRLPEFFG